MMMLFVRTFLFALASPVLGTRLGVRNKEAWKAEPALGHSGVADSGFRRLNAEDYFFLVSKVSGSQDWCIAAPDLDSRPPNPPSFEESKLRLGHCNPYFDGYAEDLQIFRLADNGKMYSGAYEDLCMIVNDGKNLGGGQMRLDNCDITSDLNKFTYDPGTKNIHLAPPNDGYCVTNEGSSPDQGDTIHAKPCHSGGRYEFEFQEAYYYWQILPGGGCHAQGTACMMSKDGKPPKAGDKVVLDHCGSPEDAWRFEEISTGAFLFHNKLDDTMCMQSGHGGTPAEETKMRFYPCDGSNALQRFVRDFDSDYTYKLSPEFHPNLCVDNQGNTCSLGDEVILKDCSKVSSDEGWYEDEG